MAQFGKPLSSGMMNEALISVGLFTIPRGEPVLLYRTLIDYIKKTIK